MLVVGLREREYIEELGQGVIHVEELGVGTHIVGLGEKSSRWIRRKEKNVDLGEGGAHIVRFREKGHSL